MKTVIVIPARYDSKRLPGKPLLKIAGKTMLARVCEIAQSVATKNTEILVATDDQRIINHAHEIGVQAVMTPASCGSGTERVFAAMDSLNYIPDFIVNLQGDVPLIPARFITALIDAAAKNGALQAFTLGTQLNWVQLEKLRKHKLTAPFSGTTVVIDSDNNSLWFSKNIIPAIRAEEKLRAESTLSPVLQHIGMYGYRYEMLKKYLSLPVGVYEKLEGLEQLRLLENGYKMHVVSVSLNSDEMITGVDSPADITNVESLLAEREKKK